MCPTRRVRPDDQVCGRTLSAHSRAASDTVLTNKAAGLARLIVGSSEYQFM
jgi:hypothetical protein